LTNKTSDDSVEEDLTAELQKSIFHVMTGKSVKRTDNFTRTCYEWNLCSSLISSSRGLDVGWPAADNNTLFSFSFQRFIHILSLKLLKLAAQKFNMADKFFPKKIKIFVPPSPTLSNFDKL
jgi:hypothetical protein